MRMSRNKGFTLIEILLVVVIIGIMLAVIVPRAWRANVDSKYGLVRQSASELASFAMQWAEGEIQSQDDDVSTATISDYLEALCDGAGAPSAVWVANAGAGQWAAVNGNVDGRSVGGGGTSNEPQPAGQFVAELIAPEKVAVNPFNGVSYFAAPNLPSGGEPIPGALASGYDDDGGDGYLYFALTFQGTDNTTDDLTDMHAGMNAETLEGLRNGVFMARVK